MQARYFSKQKTPAIRPAPDLGRTVHYGKPVDLGLNKNGVPAV